ncbi:hypothetical protein IX84_17910 [Phaeodactylibacter xiamenensis]|uniref:Uncharacterized protein n=1 Tax=Phaeodactylibacter xiamenensis TaxID=1524460 RepID=A0A098S4I7_9BACT|nr:hypothetical protein IX84_17910 [Phaeodactylibacter xiamenensis]
MHSLFKDYFNIKAISNAKDEDSLQCQEAFQAHWLWQDQAVPGKDFAHDAQQKQKSETPPA